MKTLKSKLIRLAHAKPELRSKLLPLVRTAGIFQNLRNNLYPPTGGGDPYLGEVLTLFRIRDDLKDYKGRLAWERYFTMPDSELPAMPDAVLVRRYLKDSLKLIAKNPKGLRTAIPLVRFIIKNNLTNDLSDIANIDKEFSRDRDGLFPILEFMIKNQISLDISGVEIWLLRELWQFDGDLRGPGVPIRDALRQLHGDVEKKMDQWFSKVGKGLGWTRSSNGRSRTLSSPMTQGEVLELHFDPVVHLYAGFFDLRADTLNDSVDLELENSRGGESREQVENRIRPAVYLGLEGHRKRLEYLVLRRSGQSWGLTIDVFSGSYEW